MHQPLDDEALGWLHARTEGWICGLQLASISLQTQDPRQYLARFSGGDRLLASYLAEEVMAQLPKDIYAFALRTSVVDRFCAPLADALLVENPAQVSSSAMIAQMIAHNLFMVPLDDEGRWYRYHDLFREFLRSRLQSEAGESGVVGLHLRASEWLARAGLIEDALRHTLAAGDEARAAELVEAHFHLVLDQQIPIPVLSRWLAIFPGPALDAQVGLLIAQAYLCGLRLDFGALAPLLGRIETLLQTDQALGTGLRQSRQADLDFLCGFALHWGGEALHAIPYLQRALDRLPTTHAFARGRRCFISPWPMPKAASGRRAWRCCGRNRSRRWDVADQLP